MKKFFMLFLIVLFMAATNAIAGDDALRKVLVNQGVITEAAIDKVEQESSSTSWIEALTISGAVEGTLSWQENRDDEKNADSTSEVIIDTVELGVEAAIADWITGEIVLLAEDLGAGGGALEVDEVAITLQKEALPIYLIAGKRVVPFGLFPGNFITDPMSMDAYETNAAGVTIGFTGPMDLDISATIYKGEEMMAKLFDSGLFSTDKIQRARAALGKDYDDEWSDEWSYVLAAGIAPAGEKLALGVSYISEMGHKERNNTLGFSLSSTPIEQLTINIEYIMAIKREDYYNSTPAKYAETFKEKVFFADIVFQATDSVSVAAKYEHFDDDDMADKSDTWSVKDRYAVAAFWTFYEKKNLNAFTGVEWRHSEHEVDSAVSAIVADSNNELFVKLGIGF